MGMSVLDEAVELARSGGQAGEFVAGKHAERHAEKANDDRDAKNAARGEKNLEFAVILRPDISMQQITGVPYVAAYGLVKNLKGSISNIGMAIWHRCQRCAFWSCADACRLYGWYVCCVWNLIRPEVS